MKAQIIEDYCEEPNFILRDDVPIPEPKDNEILVKLKTASVNPVDYKMREGAMKMLSSLQFPCILGKDGSGVVEKIGSKITRFKVGDEVCGYLTQKRTGSYAEYACYEEDEIVLKPSEMTFQQACAFPLVGGTIMEMYRRHPAIGEVLDREGQLAFKEHRISDPLSDENKKEMRILVIGASGGTGSVAVLFAKTFLHRYFNTKVYAVCSERNSQFVKSLGADGIIDYTKSSAKAGSHTTHKSDSSELPSICQLLKTNYDINYVDLVLDCVGGYYYYDDVCHNSSCKDANPYCVFTTISPPTEPQMTLTNILKVGSFLAMNKLRSFSSCYPKFHFIMLDRNVKDLNLLMNHALLENRAFEKIPLIPFNLSMIKEAQLQMESQRTVGKIVIDIQ
ncbi:hypothetical protein C9374_002392 [Naegleria lovaniensis]|uniref:Enoyl reductase (ER) domain-containing protein n=1 Tax=Naegleria lovaniensis TaxID=51637 RepID=A0AA88KLH9_NAELO|nr:uncharacterized protein C9374_002392 [Naegleria lovaniensis]KAG2386648.1 hypothetical protein C9374_002392 [Naegleria lovaniensis]